ncbi:hypothetical protein [Streptomyces sp. KL118A]|nr:hypothetical protein [Streptomyces sp. KL118A]
MPGPTGAADDRADGRPSVRRTVVAPVVAFLGLACVVCLMVANERL